ncbi:MAG TPA: alanine racemase, partial [Microbacteriaceae bacterium]|nr:alanine racemase [Microbacteriaceae bacterium]
MSERNPLAPAWLVPGGDDVPGTLWPSGAGRDAAGRLTIGGLAATELAERYGTPLYVVDEDEARGRARRILRAFGDAFSPLGAAVRVYYAAKAFLSVQSARWMREAGLGIDVCTGEELAVALAAGVEPAWLGLHGNNKSPAEIDEAVRVGVGTIVVDSPIEIERVAQAAARHGRVQAVRLRVNSGVHAHTHEFLATAHEDQKFGLSLDDAPAAVARIRSLPGLSFLGLHGHIGSQIFGIEGFARAAERLVGLHARLLAGGPVPQLNLGGGFGIAYTAADRPAAIEDVAAGIARAVAGQCRALGVPVPDMAFEPGRWIIGPAGVTLYRVGTVK